MSQHAHIFERNLAQLLLLIIYMEGGKDLKIAPLYRKKLKITPTHCYKVIEQFEQLGYLTAVRPKKEKCITLTPKGRSIAKALRAWYTISNHPMLTEVHRNG